MLKSQRKGFDARFRTRLGDAQDAMSIPQKAERVKKIMEEEFARLGKEWHFTPLYKIKLEQDNPYYEDSINVRIYADGDLVDFLGFEAPDREEFQMQLDKKLQRVVPQGYLEHYTSTIIDFWIHR